ncbi:hypothetical protein PVAND_011087 [Polypedilum vanderplanki]|uniref:Erythroid differentiation-related factor 1 n=1 Tax=Polypedilum vanderplanki TaxID=319348 RepID=A0A9J6CHJ7_POLVA|nr:hypothetical protein PVAND_011087 [Polypedilum vanderplanki]
MEMSVSDSEILNDDRQQEETIKSKSLIKFQAIEQFPTFATLKCDVNLKLPPNNWLNGQIKPNRSASTNSYNFSSFKMAFDFFDELQNVDVISDSENIKNLLKMAYNPSCVLSYFIHRVGNTILIDEFNLQRFFLWQSEKEWKWLKTFLADHIIGRMKANSIPIQHKTKEFLEQKNLLSKFLYYSIEDSKKIVEKEYEPVHSFNNALLPQPKREDIPENHQFSRNVLWNFEDIRMLIGSDMQIFGNQSRPCISLRLKDMSEPINVLTGIDYWLDNLMCNVPEIFMCYHLNGIVQKYELIKTEDLPNLENSSFSPKVIRNVAQNILSFLKQNATKSGHTYWLFKAKNDDVVKLYDLTTLQLLAEEKEKEKTKEKKESNQDEKQDQKNPFTIPVAILLYTVARNMKYSNEKLTTKQAGNIKYLLDNCLKLLPKEKYPQIITTSHYILSDIQIQAGTDPMDPKVPYNEENDSDENSDEYVDFDDEQESDIDLELNVERECLPAVQNIKDAINESSNIKDKHKPSHPPLILGNIQERSEETLKNIVEGLNCLKYLQNDEILEYEKQREQIIHEEQNPNILQNPDVAIPMGWDEDDKKSKSSESPPSESDNESFCLDSKSLLKGGSPNVNNWNTHLKVLLFEKASLAYACLTENYYNSKNYGTALKNLRFSLMCQNVVKKYVPLMKTQRNVLYGRAGDCFFQIGKTYDKIQTYLEEFSDESELDKEIMKKLDKEDLSCEDDEDTTLTDEGEEKMLEKSCHCYEISLIDTNQSKFEIVRRLGNVYNELGVALMHKAQRLYNEFVESENKKKETEKDEENSIDTKEMSYQQVAKSSYDNLLKAVALFEGVKDSVNLIICNLNLGRFYRLSAHINMFHASSSQKAVNIRKKLYTQAFESYNRALSLLGNRKSNQELYDHVHWELSTATFNLAKQMQDESVVEQSREDLERDVLDILMKALKLCDTESNSSRQELYIFRAGLIHQRIASLYHQQLRMISEENKRKTLLQLCRLHYEKSSNFLASLTEFRDFFKVQMERVALNEFLAEETTSVSMKMKNLQFALNVLIESLKMLNSLVAAKSIMESDEILTLLELFEKRLQFILKTLTKLAKSVKKNEQKAEMYKQMFACTLRNMNESLSLIELAKHLEKVLENVIKLQTS